MKAFPLKNVNLFDDNEGMDLRDYFAAKSLAAILSADDWFHNHGRWESLEHMAEKYAEEAYRFSDAMIKMREK